MRHLLHVTPSWERGRSAVALPEVSYIAALYCLFLPSLSQVNVHFSGILRVISNLEIFNLFHRLSSTSYG